MHVVTPDGEVVAAGRSVLFIFGKLGWWPLTTPLSWPPIIWLVEPAYRVLARNRLFFSRFFFRHDHDA